MVDRSREELKGEVLYHKEESPRYTEQNPTKITGNTIPTLYEAARRWDIGKHPPLLIWKPIPLPLMVIGYPYPYIYMTLYCM